MKTGVFEEGTDREDLNVSERRLSPKNDFTENSDGKLSKDPKTVYQNLVESIDFTNNVKLIGYNTELCSNRSENEASTLHPIHMY